MSIFAHIGINQVEKNPTATAAEAAAPAPEQEARIYTDPRPDLKADSSLWTKLLRRAEKLDPMLAGTLHGFRCGGLRIKRGRTGYLLRPDFDPTGNQAIWKDQEEYENDKLMHLFQYRTEIKELMLTLWNKIMAKGLTEVKSRTRLKSHGTNPCRQIVRTSKLETGDRKQEVKSWKVERKRFKSLGFPNQLIANQL